MIPGVTIQLNGTEYVLPPLNLGGVQQFREEIAGMMAGGVPDMPTIGKMAHHALRRNYPDMPYSVLEDGLDFGNLMTVFEALINVTGLAAAAGEMSRRIQAAVDPAG